MNQILIPATLLEKLIAALDDRIDAASYLAPETYDDEEHEASCLKADAECRAILDQARSHLPEPLTEDAHLRHIQIIDLAQQQCGDAEVNDDSIISEGNDNGCYVSAWVWVDFAGTPLDKSDPSDPSDS